MLLNRRLIVTSFRVVIVLAILAGGAFVLNKWASQPANSPPSAENSPAGAEDDPIDLPDTGLVQLTTPKTSISYYVRYIDTLYDLGFNLGDTDWRTAGTQDHLVILDYGYPIFQGGSYGAQLAFDSGQIVFTPVIIASAVDFATGYISGARDDHTSHIQLVIGVNNCCWGGELSLFQGHGAAWAGVVNSINSQISSYSSRVKVIAGSDMEQQNPGGNRPYSSTQWLAYYMANSNCHPGLDNSVDGCFYNFGNLVININISGTSCATAYSTITWQACDVWYISWGAHRTNESRFARPIPEIYHNAIPHPPWGSDANAWQQLSVFSNDQMLSGPMFFVGSLTQRARCDDNCLSGNNYPWEGFQLLSRALASNTTTRQAMHWSADIALQP